MKEFEMVEEFFTRVNDIISSIPEYGETLLDSFVVKKLLRSLSDRFESKVSTLEDCNLNSMTSDATVEVLDTLLQHVQRDMKMKVKTRDMYPIPQRGVISTRRSVTIRARMTQEIGSGVDCVLTWKTRGAF